jgi:hypothetical protein
MSRAKLDSDEKQPIFAESTANQAASMCISLHIMNRNNSIDLI